MPADGLPLAVRVGGEDELGGVLGGGLNSLTTFSLAGLISYSSWKPFSMSTPSLRGRSRMCPTEAITLYPLPRYLVMVFAFDGLSTITSFEPLAEGSAELGELESSCFSFLATVELLGG